MATPEIISAGRIKELDGLRGIAALSVLLYHYTAVYQELVGHKSPIWTFGYGGIFGVSLFFVISGYVIFMSLHATKRVRDFVLSRFSRLYPVYWVAVFFTWALTRHFGLEWRETSLDTALINLTMLQDLFNVPHVDGAYWTLVVELRFYLVVGTLYFLGAFRHFAVTLTALLAVSALYTAGLRQYPFLKAWGEFLEFLPLFAAGMTLFKLRVADRAEYPILYALLFGCIGVRALSAAFHVYMILAAIGVFLLLPTGLLRSLGSRPFVYLGTISYSLYLIHQNVGIVAIRELERVDFNPWWAITVTTIAMVAIATIMTYLVERPAARALKRRKPKLAESTPNGTAELQERTARSLVT